MIVFHLMNKNLLLPRSRLGVLWIHNAFTHTTLKQFKIITVSIEKVAGQLRFIKSFLSYKTRRKFARRCGKRARKNLFVFSTSKDKDYIWYYFPFDHANRDPQK